MIIFIKICDDICMIEIKSIKSYHCCNISKDQLQSEMDFVRFDRDRTNDLVVVAFVK